MPKLNSIKELNQLRAELRAAHEAAARPCLAVCTGSGCSAAGAEEVAAALRKEVAKAGLQDKVDIKNTGCQGFCQRSPVVVAWPEDTFYNKVTAGNAADLVASVAYEHKPVEKLLYIDPKTGKQAVREEEVPFYAQQKRVLFANNSRIDPKVIQDYLRVGGYEALAKVLGGMQPQQVVDEILGSGLRGRGGAGFPTGMKWNACRQQAETTRYVICNADEGDPGAFMDGALLEGNPHSMIEGMIIGSFAISAHEGFIYVRAEYPMAVKHLKIALAQAEEFGFLGDNILGSGHSFRINLVQGAGAFVCGEETALIASIEGRVGEPRPRPPFPVQKGLFGKPTVINNVKTWASVTAILNRGAQWYSSIGTERSKGTTVFSLVGKITNTGLVEVPMGITLRQMIYDIGGGIPEGKKFKAVQIGGPSGGCIPESLLDTPVDYEELTKYGAMMGSGGMVVMDEDTCMVDVARYFMEFLEDESCGQCFPCREGTQRLREMLARICAGKGKEEDLQLLEEMGGMIKETSLCGLGQTCPNPVLTTLRYFKDEYLAHIRDQKCPAKVCRELIFYSIDPTLCDGCGACVKVCASEGILGEKKKPHQIDDAKCIKCGACMEVCKPKAVLVN